jgi:hypothetical protein
MTLMIALWHIFRTALAFALTLIAAGSLVQALSLAMLCATLGIGGA